MKKNILTSVLSLLLITSCNDSFLDKSPLDKLSEDKYFQTENDLNTYSLSFYPLLEGYGKNFEKAEMLSRDEMSDNMAPSTANNVAAGLHLVPNSNSDGDIGKIWQWETLRNVNYFLARCSRADVSPEVLAQYQAEARFFRAYIYFPKIKAYGNVPWINKDLTVNDEELLYSNQMPRFEVVDSVLADINFAVQHLPEKGKEATAKINKDVALAFKARFCLYEGSFRKYHGLGQEEEMLREALAAAKELEESKHYTLYTTGNPQKDYQDLFIQDDLNGNPEMIFHRHYVLDKLTHNMVCATAGSMTKSLIESFLCADGTPVALNKDYSDETMQEELKDRDPRLQQICIYPGTTQHQVNIGKPGIPGTASNNTSTGYQLLKYYREDQVLMNARNYTDAPVFRYAETLLIYAEAAAELGQCDQNVLDKTINVLRDRAGMPHLSVNVGFEDPTIKELYPNVSNLIREIRRERRVELACEGYRYDDLMRWKCGKLLEKPFLGMHFVQSQYPEVKARKYGDTSTTDFSITLDKNGYIDVYQSKYPQGFTFNENKHYYMPLPLDQITMNTNLKQSPGW